MFFKLKKMKQERAKRERAFHNRQVNLHFIAGELQKLEGFTDKQKKAIFNELDHYPFFEWEIYEEKEIANLFKSFIELHGPNILKSTNEDYS